MSKIKVLCIHGIGGKDNPKRKSVWHNKWRTAIQANTSKDTEVCFSEFDDFFDSQEATLKDYLLFLRDAIFGEERAEKGLFPDFKDDFPDMIIEFFKYPNVSVELLKLIRMDIEKTKCNVIFAHSLGSLVCYDFFRTEFDNDLYKDITLITAGSQLGHDKLPKFRPIQSLNIKNWYNINNSRDGVFASEKIGSQNNNCEDITVKFGSRLLGSAHNGEGYIKESKSVWNQIKNDY